MKNILRSALLSMGTLSLFSVGARAQGWYPQISGSGNVFSGVCFVDDNTGWAVSNSGDIIHTVNGGTTWTSQISNVSNVLTGVMFTDANNGHVVGNSGVILRTTNGGASWTNLTVGSTFLNHVAFTGSGTGRAVGDGGVVLKSTDGGGSWTPLAGLTGSLRSVSFLNATTAVIVGGGGAIYRTTNGGSTWSAQSGATSNDLNDASFADLNNGTAVGDNGAIVHTTNGGTIWTLQSSGTNSSLNGVHIVNATRGFAVGANGTILRTTDGGATWIGQASGANHILNDVVFTGANAGTIVGAGGTVLRTSTGGIDCGPTVISLSPAVLSDGTGGVPQSQTITASGGTGPYSFAITSASLPAGLSLSAPGVVSGTPLAVGQFSFTVTASDGNNCQGNRLYSMTINCPVIGVNPTTLPHGTAGTSFNQAISGSAGVSPRAFGITGGSLSPGLSLRPGGEISGIPTSIGTFGFIVTVTDAEGCTGSRSYTLVIDCPVLTFSPSSLPSGTMAVAYTQTITAGAGSAPYSFTVTSGTLPPGLTLAPNGVLSGTPSVSASFTFTVTAHDAQGCTSANNYSVTINCPTITLSPSALLGGTAGSLYSQTITSGGGTPPYTFQVGAGSFPNGLTLSSSGEISGTPSLPGTFNFTVIAQDDHQCSGFATT